VKPRRDEFEYRAALPQSGCPLMHIRQRFIVQFPITVLSSGGPNELRS
jgi:hypothetical protein